MSESTARNIVIAMDGSSHADYAFKFYLDNVKKPGDHVIFVHCPENHSMYASPVFMAGGAVVVAEMEAEIAKEQKKERAFLEELGAKLKAAGIGGKVKSLGGRPGEVIVKIAEEENASIIVTGTRGMGTLRRTIMGSVSDYILHHSLVPVVVCRHKDQH